MLLIRPLPKRDEHLLAFLLRVSWLNNLRSLPDLLFLCDIKTKSNRVTHNKIVSGRINFSGIERMLGIDKVTLQNSTTTIYFDDIKSLSAGIPNTMLDFSYPKFCIKCVFDKGYINMFSSIRPVSYCTLHNQAFIEKWSDGTVINWSSKLFFERLKDGDIQPREAQSSEISLNTILIDLWSDSTVSSLPPAFHLFTFFDFLLVLKFLARFNPKKPDAEAAGFDNSKIWVASFMYIKEWPSNFHQLLHFYEVNHIGSIQQQGIRATYRDLYDELYSSEYRESYAYMFLKAAFEIFISRKETTTPLWNPNHKLISKNIVNKISFKAALKMLDMREQGLERFIALKLIIPDVCTNKGSRLFVKEGIVNFKERKKSLINLTATSKLLQVSANVVIELVANNFMTCIAKPTLEWRDWIFDIEQISAEIENLITSASPQGLKIEVKLTAPLRSQNFKGTKSADILRLMQLGKQEFYFIKDNCHKYSLRQFYPLPFSYKEIEFNDYLTPKQTSKFLKVNINAIYDLIKRQFLEMLEVKTPIQARKIKVIPKSSVSKFQYKYILKPLSKNDLLCVSGPKIDGGVVNVYKKNVRKKESHHA